jgi:hypothetical protein
MAEITLLSSQLSEREIINLVGFMGVQLVDVPAPPYRARKFTLTDQQLEDYQLLVDNGFYTITNSPKPLTRGKLIHYTLEQALEAIRRGDFVVENFLDAVEGK